MCANRANRAYGWRHLVKATEVTVADLAESNGSLPPGGWIKVTCTLTATCRPTPGSALGPKLGNEYGRTLPVPLCLILIIYGLNHQICITRSVCCYRACGTDTVLVRFVCRRRCDGVTGCHNDDATPASAAGVQRFCGDRLLCDGSTLRHYRTCTGDDGTLSHRGAAQQCEWSFRVSESICRLYEIFVGQQENPVAKKMKKKKKRN